MSAIPDLGHLLDTPLAQALGWALVQFIWQGALVGVAAAVALTALRRAGADLRYIVATISMSVMLTLPIVSVVQELDRATAQQRATAVERSSVGSGTAARLSSERERSALVRRQADAEIVFSRPFETARPAVASLRWAGWLLGGWLIGVVLLSVRLLTGWFWVQRLRRHGRPAGASVRHLAERIAGRLHVTRAVRLIESAAVDVPTVVGWLKPVILLPVSALAGLSPTQLEAVLAHELAHVRRHDYLVNLLQTVVETLLFYHPAVWWVSRQIRIERENCCDDLAVSLCGDRVLYAQTLADLEQLRGGADRLALAANGGSLVHRVRRLLGAPSHAGATPGWLVVSVAIALIVSVAGIAGRAMDRETPQAVEKNEKSVRTPSEPRASARLREKELVEWRDLARALEQSHRALYAAFRDLFPQFPPLPPSPPAPPVPPEPRVPAVPSVRVDPPEPPELPESPDLPEPPEVPLPPPAGVGDFPPPPAMAAPPAPPAVPVSPVPPMPRSQKSGNIVWTHDDEKLEVNYRGDIEFTDDDADVKSLSSDGWLRIKQSDRKGSHAIEFRPNASGSIERRFWVGSSERPFEPEGRKWVAQFLPRFIRQSGFGAEARVKRIYRTKGTQGVLDEISLIEGSWAKRVYFAELLKTPGLDARAVQQALAQAGREVDSDFELASLLISSSHLLNDEATRKTYIDAAGTIDSDFEMRRVYSAALKGTQLQPPVLAALLESSTAIGSDFELASLLIDVAKGHTLSDTTRASFFKAVATIESDFEQRRVLSSVVSRSDATPAVLRSVLDSAAGVGSDFELATLLLEVTKNHTIEGALRDAFFRAVDSIGSDFERGRVLGAAAQRRDISDETVLAIIKSTGKMHSQFESARVLLTVAGARALSREARDAYVDAAERLGEFEQGRVLSALVRNERR